MLMRFPPPNCVADAPRYLVEHNHVETSYVNRLFEYSDHATVVSRTRLLLPASSLYTSCDSYVGALNSHHAYGHRIHTSADFARELVRGILRQDDQNGKQSAVTIRNLLRIWDWVGRYFGSIHARCPACRAWTSS